MAKREAAPSTAPVVATAPQVAPTPGLMRVDAPALLTRIAGAGKRGTIVSVWATWCGSCRREIPMLLQLRDAFAVGGIDFVFVSVDQPDAFQKVVEQMRSFGGPLPALAVDGSIGSFKRAMHPGWRGALPATFLFDATAKLRHFWEGPIYEHEITPILQGFLAGEPIDGETRPPITGNPSEG